MAKRERSATGILLQKARIARGLSLRQVGKQLRCSPQFIYDVERGATSLPVSRVRKLSILLGLKPEDFVQEMVKDYSDFLMKAVSVAEDG